MTAATQSSIASTTDRRQSRSRVGWLDLCWLTWRQHRMLILLTTLAVAALCTDFMIEAGDISNASLYPTLLRTALPSAAGLIGAFWGAPLLAGEYEQRTHLVVWSQDVSPGRWLLAKLAVLGAITMLLATALSLTAGHLLGVLSAGQHDDPYTPYGPFTSIGFESSVMMQVSYALFGFALGVALGSVFRRTVAAIGATVFTFTVVRVLLALFARPYYLPSVIRTMPISTSYEITSPNPGDMYLGSGYLDRAGNQFQFPGECFVYNQSTNSGDVQLPCMRRHGLVSSFVEYQPADRLLAFHLIEFGIYLVLTVGLVLLSWQRVRRMRSL